MNYKHRILTANEIIKLETNGCVCHDWTNIKVSENFDPNRIKCTFFSGNIILGQFSTFITLFGGIKKPTGIYNASLHNCTIGDNVYINDVHNSIANYTIENGVIIENIDILAVDGSTTFGNGVEAIVLNETGGRGIPICDILSAHIAYVMAFYRYYPEIISIIRKKIEEYTLSVTATRGLIGENVRLMNCGTLKNIKIDEYAVIEGVTRLENGTINSCKDDPVYIGDDVIAKDFIVSSGVRMTDGVIIENCFIGQACNLSRQYSAKNSVFFANCGGSHGEAWSIFAGPYTVTYHKATLLISGLFSFLNAGSGSNQSNHMYKLGPVHHGIIERGSKTTSDSYILWPAKIGAFTLIMGRHYRNTDTSDLPFSYLIEKDDESILVPGINLRSVGTIRDARKWPRRDKRKDSQKLDHINFDLLSPFTVSKMIRGRNILNGLLKSSGETSDYYSYNSVRIKKASLLRGIDYYTYAINKYLGNFVIKRLENKRFNTTLDVINALAPSTNIGDGDWVDIAGLFAPKSVVSGILKNIATNKMNLHKLNDQFRKAHESYYDYAWTWTLYRIEEYFAKPYTQITVNEIINLIDTWKDSVITLNNLLIADAKKEYSVYAQIGFGIDGDENMRLKDFSEVRGEFDNDSFVTEVRDHISRKRALGDELIKRLKPISKSSKK